MEIFPQMCYNKVDYSTTSNREDKNMATKKSGGIKIPGVSFSWKRALGITQAKQKFARKTGIPTTKSGLERKVGRAVLDMLDPSESKSTKKKK